jgi:type IV secretion system protein VirB10
MIRFPWRRAAVQAAPAKPQTDEAGVRGERAKFIGSGARSLQSRMSTLLAGGLMTTVGAAMLAWYYAEALSRSPRASTPAPASLPEAAGEGMALPAFASIAPPRMRTLAATAESVPSVSTITALPSRREQAAPATLSPDPLLEPPLDRASGGLARGYGPYPQASLRQRALDRRLSGEVFAGAGSDTSSNISRAGIVEGSAGALPIGSLQVQVPGGGPRGDALQTLLRPGVLSATRAQILPTQRLLLPKGAFIDCTLETAIDSTLPGMTTCITATDTFGADGTVVLLERGTKLVGETRGEVGQGDARVFVVWTEARTPSGVVVRLDSPGTDALGRSGLDGKVNRHFWQRFGAAALVSTIDGVVQSEVQSSSRSSTVVLDPSASEDVLNDILRSTVSIPPTIQVRNGARIQVLVARDVDFRPVYELEPQ